MKKKGRKGKKNGSHGWLAGWLVAVRFVRNRFSPWAQSGLYDGEKTGKHSEGLMVFPLFTGKGGWGYIRMMVLHIP